MTRKRLDNPDPSIHRYEPRFADLSHAEQLALATWAVLLKSDPGGDTRVPQVYRRAVGDIAATVGLRERKSMNYLNPRQRRRARRSPKVATA